MPKAVRFDEYGGIDVLRVVDVDRPAPGAGEVLVRVRAAGINPGEAMIRDGRLHEIWPATFPSGQGSDLAGVVEAVGPDAGGVAVGDEVIGFTHNRASHAELVVVEAANLTPKPPEVAWEVAGGLFVVGATAWAAVRAVALQEGDVVAPERINTLIPPERAAHPEVKGDGNLVGASAQVLAELAARIAAGRLELPIARAYPLAEVRDAYAELERRHTLGKIVLVP